MNEKFKVIGISAEDLKDSIQGLSQLKPVLQNAAKRGNGVNKKQGEQDSKELGKHFDTAINSMMVILAGIESMKKDGGNMNEYK